MNRTTLNACALAAVLAAGPVAVHAADGSTSDALRHPIRTLKDKMQSRDQARHPMTDRGQRDAAAMRDRGSARDTTAMGDRGTARDPRWDADREATRERAMNWVDRQNHASTTTDRSGAATRTAADGSARMPSRANDGMPARPMDGTAPRAGTRAPDASMPGTTMGTGTTATQPSSATVRPYGTDGREGAAAAPGAPAATSRSPNAPAMGTDPRR